jgi:hypothetical protein
LAQQQAKKRKKTRDRCFVAVNGRRRRVILIARKDGTFIRRHIITVVARRLDDLTTTGACQCQAAVWKKTTMLG